MEGALCLMQIWIHDKSMRKVCALNNEIPGMLPYTNSQWHPYLEYSTSTFDFTISKIVNRKLHDDIKYINDQMFVSFYFDNSYHVFYVSKLVENDFSFQVTCNNTNLELAMEVARPLADSGGPKTIEWYLQNLELLGFAGLEIGVNEISDRTRTLTFESQSGTKLEQLHSLMNQFDAEFIFRTELNRDGTMKRFIIDIYQEADENHHGIGKARGDVVLYYQSGLKGVQVTSDKTQLFNAGNFIGQDGVNLNDVEFEEKNELGQVEFYSRKGTSFVFAPLSRERYPSTMNPDSADNWTRRDFQTEYKDVESLKAYALRTIKQYAYPLLTYTVDVQSSFLDNYKDINLGDTVKIIDNNFRGGLALEARVSEMIISFDNPTNNSVVFTNFRKLDNKPSSELQQRIDEIVSKSLPYHVEIRTTNGTVFKNGIGRSTVKPVLKQGDKIVDATYRFVIDGTIKYVGMTYDMVASEITQPTTLTIAAWVDNKEVASEEVTFVNVSDGKDGRTPYVHFAYADSADGQKGFSLTQTGSKRYLGVLTNFIKEDSTNPADYTWSDTAGSISVGGRNLLKGSKGPFKPDRKPTNFDNYVYYENETSVYLEQGEQYIISAKTDGNFTKWHNGEIESDNITLWLFRFWDVVDIVSDSNTGTTGTQFTWNHPTGTYHLRVNTYHKTAIKSVWEVKIEKGTIKTDWTPAIEDVQDEIDSKADDAMTIEQINALNERAEIIKAEMEAKASAEILNNWIKNYQDFVKANETERAAAEKALISSSQRVSIIAKELGELSDRWSFIDSYMTASNDGLVIGKNDGSSGIMINPNGRISMYSAGEEVMYISQGVIHIENGIFSKTIQVGRYREEQYHLNPDMNVIRYVGGF
jgi:hypothetical protein